MLKKACGEEALRDTRPHAAEALVLAVRDSPLLFFFQLNWWALTPCSCQIWQAEVFCFFLPSSNQTKQWLFFFPCAVTLPPVTGRHVSRCHHSFPIHSSSMPPFSSTQGHKGCWSLSQMSWQVGKFITRLHWKTINPLTLASLTADLCSPIWPFGSF